VSQVRPIYVISGQNRSCKAKSGHEKVRSGMVRSGQVNSGQVKVGSDQIRSRSGQGLVKIRANQV